MRWPKVIKAGTENDEITGIIDVLPTLCAIVGAKVPTDRVIDGRTILPYMKGETLVKPIHETFVVPGSTVRHNDWKLLMKKS